MSMMDDDYEPEIQRAPPRARQTRKVVKKRGKPQQRRALEPEVRAEAPVRRNAPRPAPRAEGTRDTAREPARRGAVIATGRAGEHLTRRRTAVLDKFEVPKSYIPVGWEYQWNTVTVLNQGIQEIVRGDLQMHENGWRPVPASRHPGHWTSEEHEGAIIIDGLRLEERPLSLSEEARAEDEMRAKSQVRDRTDALRMTQKQLPGANVASSRNNAGGMRMSIDPALDIPRPQHDIEE
jgi:hypothetical protein